MPDCKDEQYLVFCLYALPVPELQVSACCNPVAGLDGPPSSHVVGRFIFLACLLNEMKHTESMYPINIYAFEGQTVKPALVT